MPYFGLSAVDGAVLSYFERVGLDVEATRRELAQRADHDRAELRALRATSDCELVRATERLERVRRAVQDGVIEPSDWAEQRAQLTEELEGARQDAERLASRESEIAAEAGVLEDVKLLARLAELRAAIAGDVRGNPDDFAATHAALRRVFESFVLVPSSRDLPTNAVVSVDGEEILLKDVPTVEGFYLEPVPRSDAVVLSGEGAIVPVPLGLRAGVNASGRPSVASGTGLEALFGPIPVAAR